MEPYTVKLGVHEWQLEVRTPRLDAGSEVQDLAKTWKIEKGEGTKPTVLRELDDRDETHLEDSTRWWERAAAALEKAQQRASANTTKSARLIRHTTAGVYHFKVYIARPWYDLDLRQYCERLDFATDDAQRILLDILEQVAVALDALADGESPAVHGHVHPGNILIRENKAKQDVSLADGQLSIRAAMTRKGPSLERWLASPFRPPWIKATSEYGPEGDLFGLALTWCELSKAVSTRFENGEVHVATVDGFPVSDVVLRVLGNALSVKPESPHDNCVEFIRSLRNSLLVRDPIPLRQFWDTQLVHQGDQGIETLLRILEDAARKLDTLRVEGRDHYDVTPEKVRVRLNPGTSPTTDLEKCRPNSGQDCNNLWGLARTYFQLRYGPATGGIDWIAELLDGVTASAAETLVLQYAFRSPSGEPTRECQGFISELRRARTAPVEVPVPVRPPRRRTAFAILATATLALVGALVWGAYDRGQTVSNHQRERDSLESLLAQRDTALSEEQNRAAQLSDKIAELAKIDRERETSLQQSAKKLADAEGREKGLRAVSEAEKDKLAKSQADLNDRNAKLVLKQSVLDKVTESEAKLKGDVEQRNADLAESLRRETQLKEDLKLSSEKLAKATEREKGLRADVESKMADLAKAVEREKKLQADIESKIAGLAAAAMLEKELRIELDTAKNPPFDRWVRLSYEPLREYCGKIEHKPTLQDLKAAKEITTVHLAIGVKVIPGVTTRKDLDGHKVEWKADPQGKLTVCKQNGWNVRCAEGEDSKVQYVDCATTSDRWPAVLKEAGFDTDDSIEKFCAKARKQGWAIKVINPCDFSGDGILWHKVRTQISISDGRTTMQVDFEGSSVASDAPFGPLTPKTLRYLRISAE